MHPSNSREISSRKGFLTVQNGPFFFELRLSLPIYPDKGESEGYTVKSKGEDFPISDYPLLQTEFFFDQKQGMATILYPIMLSQL